MNNEEKILSMLAQIQDKLEQHDTMFAEQGKQLAELTDKVDSIDARLGKVEDMQEELRDSVNTLAKKIDRDVIPYVKLLDDDYSKIGRRVAALEKAN